ncbi:MAG: long-chain fatty acid--CoA ligase [Actinomycetota bacterium]|nr:long-chain fatty acid--CoA ligase [Actinomycetota bacterium]
MTLNLASILAQSAATNPDAPAIVAGDLTLNYATVDDFARRFAGALGDLGVRPGEHVALVLPNVPQFTVAYFGCHYAGNPVVPLNVLLTADELAYHLADSQAVAVVVWESFLGPVREAMARVPGVRELIVARADLADFSAPEGAHNLTALVLGATAVDGLPPTGPDDTAVILYTSGTTGRAKGAELTHANLYANADVASRLAPIGPETVALVTLPLFHAFGMTVMHNAVLHVGGRLVLLPRFTAAAALEMMTRHRVTFFGGVPTMFMALLHAGEASSAAGADLSALRWCVSGGAPMPAEVMAAFEGRYGVCILEGYGLSETSPVVSFTVPGRPRTPGSIGYPVPGVAMRLVDGEGQVVEEPGVPGEICVRGHNVMKGYFGKPEATAASIPDGWFRTGDIGVVDEAGAYRIVDRKKDLVIRGGYNVYPREVEEVLHRHPAVAQAAVVGVPDARLGEEIKAVVTLKPGASTTPAEIVAWCRERLAAYKYPRIVEIRESLPMNATGKVLKRALRSPAPAPAAA